jgi:hypothetical protein
VDVPLRTVHPRIRSALEIYNEEVRDLSVDEMPKLDVREAPDAVSFFVTNKVVFCFCFSSEPVTHASNRPTPPSRREHMWMAFAISRLSAWKMPFAFW